MQVINASSPTAGLSLWSYPPCGAGNPVKNPPPRRRPRLPEQAPERVATIRVPVAAAESTRSAAWANERFNPPAPTPVFRRYEKLAVCASYLVGCVAIGEMLMVVNLLDLEILRLCLRMTLRHRLSWAGTIAVPTIQFFHGFSLAKKIPRSSEVELLKKIHRPLLIKKPDRPHFFSFSFKNERVRCQASCAASLLYRAGFASLLNACWAPSYT